MIQVLKLSRRQNSMQSSRADSSVKERKFSSVSGIDSVPETMENFESLTRLSARDFIQCKEIYPTTRESVFFGLEIASLNPYTNEDCSVNEDSTRSSRQKISLWIFSAVSKYGVVGLLLDNLLPAGCLFPHKVQKEF